MRNIELKELETIVYDLDLKLLHLINERAELIEEIIQAKGIEGVELSYRKMLDNINEHNKGPLEKKSIESVFKEIFKSKIEIQEENKKKTLLVSRKNKKEDTIINLRDELIGNGEPHFVFGPCAVESYEQVAAVAKAMKEKGLKLLRGGAYKPRTSPYEFQGLGVEGLKILKRVADEYDMAVISEIVNPADVEMAAEYIDVIQIGTRNMQNYELLKAVGSINRPILLKRGMSATIEEFIYAAEYIMSKGNGQIILCERGIRTYETATRNTLDISAVPILKQETHLPVFVDVTHSTGRKDLLLPAAKAAMAIGADGVMAEVHPNPAVALSDAKQQMNLVQFDHFFDEIQKFSEFGINRR
ncbi:bifunctional 3-deoxy-7-phosphoheptulonate synthase/chorismate mutase [Clostridium sp. SHJSY1]|uniref:bifunctional 3-deoxy-7-phosphoheptulonate synthase/chorismate mutase n=1 Tax=Clostridium sp. SHJSY1 TaxID=2942483 RepID=UPI0028750E16|nr:bifunctional 3-deoxy-7-phosphoheptulonate synthase/chorismate mutase [Clostridium sp. SHJSY1]MDS0527394.1 bifunctional 3-deoxy-7-phosphoheptulonate synthase/chorismate mutase [Clostridium sp. SHJSY1]